MSEIAAAFPKYNEYVIKARTFPIILVLVPALIFSYFYFESFDKWFYFGTSGVVFIFLIFVLSQFGRVPGFKRQPKLYALWGGMPTTQLLRHRDSAIDPYTKARYHLKLQSLVPNLIFPSIQEEASDPKDADHKYSSAIKVLIQKTRDKKKYQLLFQANVSYGFWRNLWGLKIYALSVLFICIAACAYLIYKAYLPAKELPLNLSILTGFFIVVAFSWIFLLTDDMVKTAGFTYANRLIETLDDENLNSPSSSTP